jgi:hypothetical protein
MKDDKTLRDELLRQIAEIKKLSRTVQRDVESVMFADYNIDSDETIDIFNGIIRVETMPYHMLYKLMMAIKKVSKKRPEDINPSRLQEKLYFYDLEISEYSKPVTKEESEFDIVIKDGSWHRTTIFPYDYITIHTDINEVSRWDNYNKLRFNPDTQRDLVIVTTNGMPVIKLDLKESSVNEMEKDMKDYMYFPVQGTININPEINNQSVMFRNGDLIIPKEIKMDLIEGFHNYTAATRVKRNNKEWNFPYEFRIMFLNTETANRFIKQMDKKNHFNKGQLSRMDTNDPRTYIITTLNMSSRFRLKGTITNEMVTYLYEYIDRIFEFKNDNDKFDIFDLLQDELNFIISNRKHNDPLTKEEWFCYLYLIDKCRKKNTDIQKLIQNVNLHKFINELKINKKPTLKHMQTLDNYIEEVR